MNVLTMVGAVAVVFGTAYIGYGRYLRRAYDLDDSRRTPAHKHTDDGEYSPARRLVLFGHHFSSIAGAAVIVGPITAALAWGWLPALVWIVVGTVVFGALNDFSTLVGSMRHGGQSVGHLFDRYVGGRGRRLLLSLGILANLLVVGTMSLVTAVVFDAFPSAATASIVYIGLALSFGVLRRRGVSFRAASILGVVGVFAGVFVGLQYPLTLVASGSVTVLPTVINPNVSAWLVVVLLYGLIASVLPVGVLLQPRDYLSSFLLYAGLGGAVVAIVVGTLFGTASAPLTMQLDAFTGFHSDGFGGLPLVPMLFPTIFCGAVCGLHSMVCCGTTPKQIDRETDALSIGYGSTLAEGILAVVAIGAVAVVPRVPSGTGVELALPSFAEGGAIFLSALGVPPGVGAPFMALVLSAFALTTADTALRLCWYFTDELVDTPSSSVGRMSQDRRIAAVAFVVGAYALVASGSWSTVWPLFGGAVQVFAGISMVTVAAWLRSSGRSREALLVTVGGGFVLAASLAAIVYLASESLQRLLDESWIETVTTVQIASSVVQLLVACALVVFALAVVRSSYAQFREQEGVDSARPHADD